MENRIHKRKIVDINVNLHVEGISHAGIVENISEKGIYVVTNPSKTSCTFTPETKLELRFKLPTGESLNVPCQVKWSYKTPPHGITYSIGLEILKASSQYIEFLSALE